MKKILLSIMLGGFALSAFAEGGTTIGSGGDSLRNLYNDAKGIAASKVEQLSPCSFDQSTPQSIQDWLIKNQTQFALDLRLAQHAWVVDSQSTCAFTNHSSQATIYLSYPTCSTTGNSLDGALFTLIHETAHHLGIDDERQADDVARAVMYSKIVSSCSNGGTVFDSNICNSAPMTTDDARRYFSPGQASATIGNYKFYGQIKKCTTLSGCTAPKPWAFTANQHANDSYSEIKKLALTLRPADKSPYFSSVFSVTGNAGDGPNTFEYALDKTSFASSLTSYYPAYLYFGGYSYDQTETIGMDTQKPPTGAHFGRDCLWSKWTLSKETTDGVTEVIDLVLYGTH